MFSRSSETVRLIDLLTESTVRMKQSLENRQQEGTVFPVFLIHDIISILMPYRKDFGIE